ncbi:MAG: bifunctional diaminohydroxyphosphoribosylaminopyrimidine deaminase/5-amino-6-(5-phosphoribosylamino)uracil reductase RibD [Planctomycetota bacterium]
MSTQDENYMLMALRLARQGIGSVEPNPVVGAVIVKANQVIGRGCHKKFGGPHAEIHALEDCTTLGVRPQGATMYVTLEPCSHYGKTPPCTRAIISAGVARVFVAMIDPSEHASGKGIEQLRQAGIDVEVGLCESHAKLLNAPFIKFTTTGKCWVTLKWAQTIDSKVAWADKSAGRRWISNEQSRRDVHKLRRRAQAVLVGINTVIADNPLLTARPSRGRKVTRIVMDSFLRIPHDCQLLDTADKDPVIIFASERAVWAKGDVAERITGKGAEILAYPDTGGSSNLHFLLDALSNRGIFQLLVEGGPTVLASFLKENLADEIIVYISPRIIGSQGSAETAGPMTQLYRTVDLHNVEIQRFGEDIRFSGFTEKSLAEISAAQMAPEDEVEACVAQESDE